MFICVCGGGGVSHATMVDAFVAADTKKICKKRTQAVGEDGQEGQTQFGGFQKITLSRYPLLTTDFVSGIIHS